MRQDGQYLSPLLAAFTARVITLEQPTKFGIDGSGFNAAGSSHLRRWIRICQHTYLAQLLPVSKTSMHATRHRALLSSWSFQQHNMHTGGGVTALPPEQEDALIQLTIERCLSQNDPVFETIKMQVTFEAFYAMELQRLRTKHIALEKKNMAMLDTIVAIGAYKKAQRSGWSL